MWRQFWLLRTAEAENPDSLNTQRLLEALAFVIFDALNLSRPTHIYTIYKAESVLN